MKLPPDTRRVKGESICSFVRNKTGYQGQRYEVRAKVHATPGCGKSHRGKRSCQLCSAAEEFVVGWAVHRENALVALVDEHPDWHSARVVDLHNPAQLRTTRW